jgi:hypothetical protein
MISFLLQLYLQNLKDLQFANKYKDDELRGICLDIRWHLEAALLWEDINKKPYLG